MKKFLLLSVAAIAALSASAEIKNYVVNGDFEDKGFEQAVPGGYTWDPWDKQNKVSVLPGWTIDDGGEWNGGTEVIEEEGDDFVRPESDTQYLHLWGYNDDGWTAIKISQVLAGLTPGREYTLEFVLGINWPQGSAWTPDPDYGFIISEVDRSGAEVAAGRELKKESAFAEDQEMNPFKYTFTPTTEELYLTFYLGNYYGKDNKHDNLWMDLDLVKFYSEEEGGVEDIMVDANAPVEYFNLQGIRVANPENGLFIRRQGAKVSKVAL